MATSPGPGAPDHPPSRAPPGPVPFPAHPPLSSHPRASGIENTDGPASWYGDGKAVGRVGRKRRLFVAGLPKDVPRIFQEREKPRNLRTPRLLKRMTKLSLSGASPVRVKVPCGALVPCGCQRPLPQPRGMRTLCRSGHSVVWCYLLVVSYMACAYCLRFLEDELVRFVESGPYHSLFQKLHQVGSRIVFPNIENPFTVFLL